MTKIAVAMALALAVGFGTVSAVEARTTKCGAKDAGWDCKPDWRGKVFTPQS